MALDIVMIETPQRRVERWPTEKRTADARPRTVVLDARED